MRSIRGRSWRSTAGFVCRVPVTFVVALVFRWYGWMRDCLPRVRDGRGRLRGGNSALLSDTPIVMHDIYENICTHRIRHEANTLPFPFYNQRPRSDFHTASDKAYKIVVAVPTNSRLAFSPPAFLGWSFVSLALGRLSGSGLSAGRSRVGASEVEGSIVRCFILCPTYPFSFLSFGVSRISRFLIVILVKVDEMEVCGHS